MSFLLLLPELSVLEIVWCKWICYIIFINFGIKKFTVKNTQKKELFVFISVISFYVCDRDGCHRSLYGSE
jgi:hypothetical protein